MTKAKARYRCAIYTRKSTEEGLEQEFNTLDAQRSSCEAYILSQAGEGWECIPNLYDDGGWSGGNMKRPAVKQLLNDIATGQIDIVVVYKVDRLTRSLMDFARMVETFDMHEVSFVSVTQAFNTTNSMGRLTLNVLLSFAQFEREVTGERIRDKIAASKARGMWMGGNLPLGYDVDDRKLHIVEAEADTVRMIFNRYLELGSVPALAKELAKKGIRSKRWISRRGNTRGGINFSCGALYHILNNRIYRGDIVHKGKAHEGDHKAIVSKSLFENAQKKLESHRQKINTRRARAAGCALTGRIFDSDDNPLRPTFGYGRGKKIYRYYVSEHLLPNGKIGEYDNRQDIRLSAERIERLIADRLKTLMPRGAPANRIFDVIEQVRIAGDDLVISLEIENPASIDNRDNMLINEALKIDPSACIDDGILKISIDGKPMQRGKTIGLKHNMLDGVERKKVLAELVRTSHRKLIALNGSSLNFDNHASMTSPKNKWDRERIAIGLLAPDIQKALLKGDITPNINPQKLLSRDLPIEWDAQRKMFGLC